MGAAYVMALNAHVSEEGGNDGYYHPGQSHQAPPRGEVDLEE